MLKRIGMLIILSFFWGTFSLSAQESQTGLLLFFYGTPSPVWNNFSQKIAEAVQAENESTPTFAAIETAFLEDTPQNARDGIARLEDAGAKSIVVVPIWTFPCADDDRKVHAALGIHTSAKIRSELEEAGIKTASPHVAVTTTDTLCEGGLLEQFVVSEIRELSKDRQNESLILLTDRISPDDPFFDEYLNAIVERACEETGLEKGEFLCRSDEENFRKHLQERIQEESDAGKSPLFVGLYATQSAEKILSASQINGADACSCHSLQSVHESSPLLAAARQATAKAIFQIALDAAHFDEEKK